MLSDPKEVIYQWIHAINTGNIQALLALYHKEAVLIPTFSNRILNTPEKIEDYFTKLSCREELSLAIHANTVHVHHLMDDFYSVTGIYCWRFSIDGELLSFEARFSCVVNLREKSPILQHHSSQIPRTL